MSQTPQHIPWVRLADMAEGRPSAEASAEERAHLTACAICAGEAEQLGRLTALMRADNSADAPAEALASVVRMFRARRATAAAEPGLLRRLVAALTFDSTSLRPVLGVRAGAAAPARQLLFSAGDFDLDLRLAPGGGGWTVSGQVLGPCGEGHVELLGADGTTAARAALNELCEFTLPAVAAGDYALRLRLEMMEVEVPELSLKA